MTALLVSGHPAIMVPSNFYQIRETTYALVHNLVGRLIQRGLRWASLYPEQLEKRVQCAFKTAQQAGLARQWCLFHQ